jgi:RNA recognition motif-containing protein
MTTTVPPNKALHLTGLALRFFETSRSLQPARQVNAFVSPFGLATMPQTLYVGPLLASVTEGDLTCLFAQYGTVTKAQIPMHPVLGGLMGFGFVEMADGAEEAIAGLNATEFRGTVLTVNEAESTERKPTPKTRAATHSLQIKDITIAEIKAGKNWRVLNPDALLDDVPMESLRIEPLGQYITSDTVVYSGIYVYLKGFGDRKSLREAIGLQEAQPE